MLATGSSASQLIGIVSMVMIARLYDPSEFGIFAVFTAYSGMLALVATAKYDAAVFMARRPREAADLTMLGIAISGIAGLFILLLTPALTPLLVSETAQPTAFMVLMAVATASGGAMAAIMAWAMQVKAFKIVTQGRVAQSILVAVLGVGLGLLNWGAIGLIIALVAGQIIICAFLVWHLGFLVQARQFRWRAARVRALRNIRFPQYLLLSELLNFVGNNVISFVSPALFGVAQLGQYNISQRVSAAPITVIGTAMSGVFRSAVSPQHLSDKHHIRKLFRLTFVRLCAIGGGLTLPLLLAGPKIFEILLGQKWSVAGHYVQILSPLIFIRFVASPLSAVLLLTNHQRLDAILQTLFVIAATMAVIAGAWTSSFLLMLITLTILQTIIYCIYLVISYKLVMEMSPA